MFGCRRSTRAVIFVDGRVTRYSVGERCDIVFIMFLFWFTLLFFYKWLFRTQVAHLKNIDSLSVWWFILFEQLVSIFASWTADGLFGWLFSYFCFCFCCWLVSRFGWLALVHSGAGWLLAWPHHDHFTPWFHRTRVQRWPQWLAAQVDIANLKCYSLFRGTEPRPVHLHIRYFKISETSDRFPFLNWQIVDILRYLGVTARWKKCYKLLSRSVVSYAHVTIICVHKHIVVNVPRLTVL